MNPKFIRCEYCKAVIPSETCALATYKTVIEGKEYIFCCKQCAQRYQKRKGNDRK